jgi:hypothetical protein
MAGRLKFVVASVLAGASLAGGAADDNPLADERWRARPLVIVVPAADDPLLAQVQTALLSETTRAAFEEREMVLYKVVAGAGSRAERPLSASQTQALLGALGVAANGPATAFLVGKDGGVKISERGSISLDGVFAAIDQMPMRRR